MAAVPDGDGRPAADRACQRPESPVYARVAGRRLAYRSRIIPFDDDLLRLDAGLTGDVLRTASATRRLRPADVRRPDRAGAGRVRAYSRGRGVDEGHQ